jgi:hypothetical protein
MKSLIIVKGQIGQALFEIFSKVHECYIRDVLIEQNDPGEVEVLHIAYPYSENFIDNTKEYVAYYRPQLTIIHSSVAVGTTRKIGGHIVHSPERGRFPNLAKEMLIYKKFVGGFDIDDVDMACAYFQACKWETQAIDSPNTTELLKLISNIHMGLEIAWRQEVARMGCNTEVYSLWEESYRAGYLKMGQHNLIRPIMKPGPIGGHCILPCTEILGGQFESKLFDFIKESNEKRKQEESFLNCDADSAVSHR